MWVFMKSNQYWNFLYSLKQSDVQQKWSCEAGHVFSLRALSTEFYDLLNIRSNKYILYQILTLGNV